MRMKQGLTTKKEEKKERERKVDKKEKKKKKRPPRLATHTHTPNVRPEGREVGPGG